jgi:hypothetical protein
MAEYGAQASAKVLNLFPDKQENGDAQVIQSSSISVSTTKNCNDERYPGLLPIRRRWSQG